MVVPAARGATFVQAPLVMVISLCYKGPPSPAFSQEDMGRTVMTRDLGEQ